MKSVLRAICPFPTISADGTLAAGTFYSVPRHCERCKHKMCRTLPKASQSNSVLHTPCSEGFSTYACSWGDLHLRIVGVLDLHENTTASPPFKKKHRTQKVQPNVVAEWRARVSESLPAIDSVVGTRSQELLNSLHDVKTACNAIIRNAEEVVADYDGSSFDEKLSNAPDKVRALYGSAQLLIDQLELSSIAINPEAATASQQHPVPVHKLFFKYVRLLSAVAQREGVQIILKGYSVGKTRGYDSLAMIPLTLIQNAIKYSQRKTEIHTHVNDHEDRVEVRITNVGPRIDERDAERIFEKGVRLQAAEDHPGFGIGLYIAQTVARAHGTKITVMSEPFRDGTFRTSFSVDFVRCE